MVWGGGDVSKVPVCRGDRSCGGVVGLGGRLSMLDDLLVGEIDRFGAAEMVVWLVCWMVLLFGLYDPCVPGTHRRYTDQNG